jgi:hypothetical protein
VQKSSHSGCSHVQLLRSLTSASLATTWRPLWSSCESIEQVRTAPLGIGHAAITSRKEVAALKSRGGRRRGDVKLVIIERGSGVVREFVLIRRPAGLPANGDAPQGGQCSNVQRVPAVRQRFPTAGVLCGNGSSVSSRELLAAPPRRTWHGRCAMFDQGGWVACTAARQEKRSSESRCASRAGVRWGPKGMPALAQRLCHVRECG